MKKYAVITADLVESRMIKSGAREKLYTAIDDFAKELQPEWINQYERFRGDSFQYSTVHVQSSLRAALLVRCFVLSYQEAAAKTRHQTKGYSNTKFDIRLAIGVGSVDFINEKKLSSSDGEAFARSGQSLDQLKKAGERMAFFGSNEAENTEWETIVTLMDAIIQKWTQNGAEVILQKLLGKRDDEVAEMFAISVSAVTQRKKNAHWNAINKTLLYFEAKFSV